MPRILVSSESRTGSGTVSLRDTFAEPTSEKLYFSDRVHVGVHKMNFPFLFQARSRMRSQDRDFSIDYVASQRGRVLEHREF
jgi:hypothetical protein